VAANAGAVDHRDHRFEHQRAALPQAPGLEPVSKTSGHHFHATKPYHAEEVFDVILPSRDQATKPLQRAEQMFDAPPSTVAA
jgi:hypothetical protein